MSEQDFRVKKGLFVTEGARIGENAVVDGDIEVAGVATVTGNIRTRQNVTLAFGAANGAAANGANITVAGSGANITFQNATDSWNLNRDVRLSTGVIDGTGTTGQAFPSATSLTIGSTTGTATIRNATTAISGDLRADGSIVTDQNTFNLLNSNATTVNAFGASTTLNMGATTGTATIRNATTVISGNLRADGAITTNQPSFNLLNSGVSTLNIGGAASSVNIGATNGTTFFGGSIDIASNVTVGGNIVLGNNAGNQTTIEGALAVNSGVINTNQSFFSLADANATNVTAFSSASSISIGSSGGTTAINNNLEVLGDELNSSSTTFKLLNNSVETVNAFGDATEVNIGDTFTETTFGGKTNINGVLVAGENISALQNVFIAGNLIVQGDQSVINTNVLTARGNIISLSTTDSDGSGTLGEFPFAGDTFADGGGLQVRSLDGDKTFVWRNAYNSVNNTWVTSVPGIQTTATSFNLAGSTNTTTVNVGAAATTFNIAGNAAASTTTTVGPARTGNNFRLNSTAAGTNSLSSLVTTGTQNVFTGLTTGTLNLSNTSTGTANIWGSGTINAGTSAAAVTTLNVGGLITGNTLTIRGTAAGTTTLGSSVTTGTQNVFTGITTGTLNFGTGVTGAGVINVGNATTPTGRLNVNARVGTNFLPNVTETHNIGSVTLKWNDIFCKELKADTIDGGTF